MRVGVLAGAVLGACLGWPTGAAAQAVPGELEPGTARSPATFTGNPVVQGAVGQLQFRGEGTATPGTRSGLFLVQANALLAGLAAGLEQRMRGGSFLRGFGTGALGGAVAYWGRKLGASRATGAGLAGRTVHALGSGVVRNAAGGADPLESMNVPLGPLRFRSDRDGGARTFELRVSAAEALVGIWAVATPHLAFDASRSLSAGALVFESRELRMEVRGREVRGISLGGTVLLSGSREFEDEVSATFAHERVHVLQHDFADRLWTSRAERWLLERLPGGDRVPGWLEPGLLLPLLWGSASALDVAERRSLPWEVEALSLAGR